jgi:superfamily II DNA helicase RecQ
MTVEQAVHNTTFREFLYHLHITNQLDRVVFNKCHLAITTLSYHQAMALLPQLRELQVQTIFLTGTLPPVLVPEFQKHMLLDGARFIQGPTTQQDIYLGVHYCPPGQAHIQDFTLPRLRHSITTLEPGERGIIYYMQKALSKEIATALAGPVYHSKSSTVEEKAQVLQCWHNSDPPFLVATSAFGMGVNHLAVHWVIHISAPNNIINFMQEIRRLSRDGAGGQALILLPPQWRLASKCTNSRPLDPMEATMEEYLDKATLCCKWLISRVLDSEAQACDPDALLYDHCEEHGQP